MEVPSCKCPPLRASSLGVLRALRPPLEGEPGAGVITKKATACRVSQYFRWRDFMGCLHRSPEDVHHRALPVTHAYAKTVHINAIDKYIYIYIYAYIDR